MNNQAHWYNFKTKEYEYIKHPEDVINYISQEPAAQNMFKCYMEMGLSNIEAGIKVLEACCGDIKP